MSQSDLLPCVEIEPRTAATASVIWLHGLGADAHDFPPIVPELGLPPALSVRFVFPNAPLRGVTINMGMIMRAWFDIRDLSTPNGYDAEDVKESASQLHALVARENERGIPCGRIVLAGFSQGGAIALYQGLRHPERLAGILALSTFLVEADALPTEACAENKGVPIFMAHGQYDPLVPIAFAEWSRDRLQELEHSVDWHTYPMEHAVHPREIHDIGSWLSARLA